MSDQKQDESNPAKGPGFKPHPGQTTGQPGSDPHNHAKNDQATTQGQPKQEVQDKAMPDKTKPDSTGEQSSSK